MSRFIFKCLAEDIDKVYERLTPYAKSGKCPEMRDVLIHLSAASTALENIKEKENVGNGNGIQERNEQG